MSKVFDEEVFDDFEKKQKYRNECMIEEQMKQDKFEKYLFELDLSKSFIDDIIDIIEFNKCTSSQIKDCDELPEQLSMWFLIFERISSGI